MPNTNADALAQSSFWNDLKRWSTHLADIFEMFNGSCKIFNVGAMTVSQLSNDFLSDLHLSERTRAPLLQCCLIIPNGQPVAPWFTMDTAMSCMKVNFPMLQVSHARQTLLSMANILSCICFAALS